MERKDSKKARKRRRTCWDRIRRWALEQQRQRRKKTGNPAAQVLLQIAALLLLLMPPIPVLEMAPQPMPRPRPKPKPKARPDAVPAKTAPSRYTRFDKNGWPSRYKGQMPTFGRLLRDIRRPYREDRGAGRIVHEDAVQALTAKVEPDVRPWLDRLLADGRIGDLAAAIRPGATEDETHDSMLEAAIEWTRIEREATVVIPPDPDPEGEGGSAGTDQRPTETPAPDDSTDPTKKGPK